MKIKYTYLLVLFTVIGLQAQETKSWTLQMCIEHAIKNNISIQNAALDVEVETINKRAAVGAFLPNLNASGNHSWNVGLNTNFVTGVLVNQTTQQSSGGVSSGVTLFNGLQNQNRLRRSHLSRVATEFQLGKIKEDVSLNIANAYLQIVFNKENIKIQKAQLKDNQLQYKRVEQLVTGGQRPKGELLNIKANIASNEQQLILAENTLYISKISLAQLLQLDNPETFEIAEDNYAFELSSVMAQKPSAIFDVAKGTHVSIKKALADIDVAQKDIAIAKGSRSPILSGFYNFNTRVSHAAPLDFFTQAYNNLGHNFGFSVNVPIFNGFSARNAIDRSKISFERAKLNAQLTESELEKNIHIAYANTESALKAYEASKIVVDARKEALTYAKDRYEVGMNNSYDVNQAQTLLTTAEVEVVKAKYDYLFRVKIIELYFGMKLF